LFEFLKGKTAVKPGQIGLAYEGHEMAMVWASAEGSTAKLNHWELLTNQEQGLEQALLDRVTTLELENMPCNVVLDASHYRLLLLEAPNVEADELPKALRFLMRDKIDLPLDEIEITTFPVPEDAYPRQGKMVYAIAANRKSILEARDLVLGTGLNLKSIDIPELSLKNIASIVSEKSEAIAFLDFRKDRAPLSLSKNGVVYLCRNLNSNIEATTLAFPDWNERLQRLVLELQRSLDYFESQMGQGQVTRLMIAPVPGVSNQLIEELNLNMAVNCELLDLNQLWGNFELMNSRDQHDCLYSTGAAFRGLTDE
jgi:MSHA biogenesis protein MshI